MDSGFLCSGCMHDSVCARGKHHLCGGIVFTPLTCTLTREKFSQGNSHLSIMFSYAHIFELPVFYCVTRNSQVWLLVLFQQFLHFVRQVAFIRSNQNMIPVRVLHSSFELQPFFTFTSLFFFLQLRKSAAQSITLRILLVLLGCC